MADFYSSIKNLNDKLNKFIKEYESLDDMDPLTMNLLKSFKKKIAHFNTSSLEYTVLLKKYKTNFDKDAKNKLDINKEQIQNVNTKLDVTLDIIKSKYINKSDDIKAQIKDAKNNLKNKISDLDLDVDFFISASNQKSEIYDDEYEANVKKYNYQIEVAQDSYDSSIKEFNDAYEIKSKEIEKNYYDDIKKLDLETNRINEHLQSRINEYNKLLNKYLNNLTSVNNETKEKNRQESVALNQEIKKLIDERNSEIVIARDKYSNALNSSSIAKEEKHQQYQTEGQKIQKEFVISISEQDEYSNACKKEFDVLMNQEKRNYYFTKIDETLRQNKALEKLNSEIDDEKIFKKRLKDKNKYYYIKKQEFKNSFEKKLNSIETNYQIQSEEIRYNKAVLELSKNHSIKIINNKEQTDNKYYQQLDSIYENDMNLAIKLANLRYNKKANTAKCASRIRLKHIEKESDVAEANLQKKIEGLNTEIAKLQSEIDLNSNLRDTTYKYKTDSFNNWKKNLNVSNTLEIEKCKILNNYNKRQFADNILISKAVLNHGKEKLEYENKKCVDVHDITIEIEKEKTNDLVTSLNYKMKLNQQYQNEDEQIQIRNTRYDTDVLKNELSRDRYKFEIKLINQFYSILISLSKELEAFSNVFLSEFFNNVQIRPIYEKMIINFINNFEISLAQYFESLLEAFSELITTIVEDRLKFDEQNKFKPYYNDLEKQKQADLKILSNKRNALDETIKTYNESLASYSNRVFNIRNQRELVKQKIATKDTKNKESLRIEFRNYNQKIKEFNTRFEEVSKLRDATNQEIAILIEKIEKTNADYEKRFQEIKSMQANASSAYISLENSIKKYVINIIAQELSFENIYKFDFSLFTDSHIKKEIDKRATLISNDNNIIFGHIYNIISQFRETMTNTMQKEKELLFSKFQNDISHISSRTNNTIEDINDDMEEKLNTIRNKIGMLENKKKNIIKDYDQKFSICDNNHNDEIERINQNKQASLNRFYSEFYSMCRNQDNLTNMHDTTIKNLDSNHYSNRQKLNMSSIEAKKEATLKLEQFIQSKESLINHLPVATKFFVATVSKEKDENNQNLDNDIKNAKIEAYQNKKSIEKAISTIEFTGNQEIDIEKSNYEKNLTFEKRKHSRIIKKIDKTKIEYNI